MSMRKLIAVAVVAVLAAAAHGIAVDDARWR